MMHFIQPVIVLISCCRKMDSIDAAVNRLKSLEANDNGLFIVDQLQTIFSEYKKDSNAGE